VKWPMGNDATWKLNGEKNLISNVVEEGSSFIDYSKIKIKYENTFYCIGNENRFLIVPYKIVYLSTCM